MSRAEKFIQDYTRNCSNEYLTDSKPDGLGGYISRRKFSPWLTPDQARRAVEIAREEAIEEFEQWLIDNTHDYYDGEDEFVIFGISKKQDNIINDLKQAMKDE